MTIICVYIQYDLAPKKVSTVIENIEKGFPCFTHTKILDSEYLEFQVNCREEDTPYIERILANWI